MNYENKNNKTNKIWKFGEGVQQLGVDRGGLTFLFVLIFRAVKRKNFTK